MKSGNAANKHAHLEFNQSVVGLLPLTAAQQAVILPTAAYCAVVQSTETCISDSKV